jgi:uncharacterized membrane protein
MPRNQARWPLWLAGVLFIGVGVLHFVKTDTFVKIMPPYIPWHRAMVLISGAAEIAGGVGLFVPSLRTAASWGLAALLVAVFPANVYMAQDNVQVASFVIPQALLWVRLPLQGVLIWWVIYCGRIKTR